jgi:hypothetical protein
MRTQEDLEEFRQDLLDDDRADRLHEYMSRNDYDYFLDNHIEELVGQLQDLDKMLKDAHEEFGYDYDIRDLI